MSLTRVKKRIVQSLFQAREPNCRYAKIGNDVIIRNPILKSAIVLPELHTTIGGILSQETLLALLVGQRKPLQHDRIQLLHRRLTCVLA